VRTNRDGCAVQAVQTFLKLQEITAAMFDMLQLVVKLGGTQHRKRPKRAHH
jgi:hypothetical protein